FLLYHPAPPKLYPLSLHDALPILRIASFMRPSLGRRHGRCGRSASRTLALQHPVGGGDDILRPQPERVHQLGRLARLAEAVVDRDRKSTRLNSSHVAISYAVFCLK